MTRLASASARLGLLAALSILNVVAPAAAQSTAPASRLLDILVAAYPEFLERHDGDAVIWKDGTRTPLGAATPVAGEGTTEKSLAALFDRPTLRDIFHWPYPLDTPSPAPVLLVDPGRIRVEGFFTKLYGDCRKNEVAPHMTAVAWLPKKKGGSLQITRVNGVDKKLSLVSDELDALPQSFDKFLIPAAGGYNCRPIAGTSRLSAHGTGTAVDLAVKHAHYWRWSKPDADNRYPYRNAMPPEIVRVFEKHGFIWGGKWYHYDTMHFEYRPEILAAAKL